MDGATFVSLTGATHREDEAAPHGHPRPLEVRLMC